MSHATGFGFCVVASCSTPRSNFTAAQSVMANDEKNDSPVSPIDIGRDKGVLTDEKLAAVSSNGKKQHGLS